MRINRHHNEIIVHLEVQLREVNRRPNRPTKIRNPNLNSHPTTTIKTSTTKTQIIEVLPRTTNEIEIMAAEAEITDRLVHLGHIVIVITIDVLVVAITIGVGIEIDRGTETAIEIEIGIDLRTDLGIKIGLDHALVMININEGKSCLIFD